MNEPQLTADRLKEIASTPTFIACAKAVFHTKAFAQAERERVDSYILPLFELYTFTVAPKFAGRRGNAGDRITDIKRLWLAPDEQTTPFYEECDKEHRAHGFKGKKGQCPALVAENMLAIAERNLLDHAKPLLIGERGDYMTLEQDKAFLEILLGLAVKAAKPGELESPYCAATTEEPAEPTARPRIRP